MGFNRKCRVMILSCILLMIFDINLLQGFELSGVWSKSEEIAPLNYMEWEFSWGKQLIGRYTDFYIDLESEIPSFVDMGFGVYPKVISAIEKLRDNLFRISCFDVGLESEEMYIHVINENKIWVDKPDLRAYSSYGRGVVYHRIAGPGADLNVSLEGVTDDLHKRYSGLWAPIDEKNPTLQKWGGSWGVGSGSTRSIQIDLVRSLYNMFIDSGIVSSIDKVEYINGNTVKVSGEPHDRNVWDERLVWIFHLEDGSGRNPRLWIETTDTSEGYMDGPWGRKRSSATLLKKIAGPGVSQ